LAPVVPGRGRRIRGGGMKVGASSFRQLDV
jgi:hypothetical protein